MVFFVIVAVVIGLLLAGFFVWGHKHGVDKTAVAAIAGALTAAAHADAAKVAAKVEQEAAKL